MVFPHSKLLVCLVLLAVSGRPGWFPVRHTVQYFGFQVGKPPVGAQVAGLSNFAFCFVPVAVLGYVLMEKNQACLIKLSRPSFVTPSFPRATTKSMTRRHGSRAAVASMTVIPNDCISHHDNHGQPNDRGNIDDSLGFLWSEPLRLPG